MLGVFDSNDRKQRGGAEKVERNFSKLALALGLFVAVFLLSTRSEHSTSAGHVATDLVETQAGWVYASSDCAVGEKRY